MKKMRNRRRKTRKENDHLDVNYNVYAPLFTDNIKVKQNEESENEITADETDNDSVDETVSETHSDQGHSTHRHSSHKHSTHRHSRKRQFSFRSLWRSDEDNDDDGLTPFYRRKKKKKVVRTRHSSPHHRHHSRKSSKSKEKSQKKISGWIAVPIVLVLLIIVVTGTFVVLKNLGERSLLDHDEGYNAGITAPSDAEIENGGRRVTYQGKTYQRNEAVTAILCMGIDNESLQDDSRQIGENGQADTLFVVALDTGNGDMTLVNISRDSMVDVDIYNVQNEYTETKNMQICLAYAYGNGRETSCENTAKSVSRLLYGIPIDAYAAIDLPAIAELNDAIGGVEVEVLEDMTDWDPNLIQGSSILLQGSLAETYVRSRYSEGEKATVDANNLRMARQRQYLISFISKTLSKMKSNPSLPVTLYNTAAPYMETDISVSEVTYLASLLAGNSFGSQNIVTVPGEVKMGEEYAEYHVDEEKLYQIILDVFYTEMAS